MHPSVPDDHPIPHCQVSVCIHSIHGICARYDHSNEVSVLVHACIGKNIMICNLLLEFIVWFTLIHAVNNTCINTVAQDQVCEQDFFLSLTLFSRCVEDRDKALSIALTGGILQVASLYPCVHGITQ